MSVTLNLHLYGKPGWMLREGEDVTPEELRALAADVHTRLLQCADIVEKLTGAGWEAQMLLYDICLSHPYITTAVQAEQKLHDLGIDPEALAIDVWEDEDDFDDEEFVADEDDEDDASFDEEPPL